MNSQIRLIACTAVAGLISSGAQAASLSASQVLQQFNLVVTGNATSSSGVGGRSFIGGNLDGGTFETNVAATPASLYAGLTVLGSGNNIVNPPPINVDGLGITVLGNLSNSNINNGPAVVGGNAINDNFNGTGGSFVAGARSGGNANSGSLSAAAANAAIANATSTNFGAVIGGLSAQLSHLAQNSAITVSGNTATFNATPVNGVAVFDLTGMGSSILGLSQYNFNLDGATTVILNSDASTASINANFLAGSALALAPKTIWNFYQATQLNIGSQFGGTVLAPLASLTNTQNIEGDVLVASLDERAAINLHPFTGNIAPVPEPATWASMLAGMALLLLVARRRRH